jgi:hypothetical protein
MNTWRWLATPWHCGPPPLPLLPATKLVMLLAIFAGHTTHGGIRTGLWRRSRTHTAR